MPVFGSTQENSRLLRACQQGSTYLTMGRLGFSQGHGQHTDSLMAVS